MEPREKSRGKDIKRKFNFSFKNPLKVRRTRTFLSARKIKIEQKRKCEIYSV